MNTKKNINRRISNTSKRRPGNVNKNYSRVPFWKDADGSIFIKENGRFVPFTGDIEELLGVQES